ncbi:MAG: hypothetical protein WKF96_12880 [Solirubrobacteraceae bacterium]
MLADSGSSGADWPYWLDRPARICMVEARRRGRLVSQTPLEIVTPYPDHGLPDDAELVEGCAVLELAGGGYVLGHARLRNFPVFVSGVTPRTLASSVAVADAGRQLDLILDGQQPPHDADDVRALLHRTRGWSRQGGALSSPQ